MKIPKYRIRTLYHGPYVWCVPQVKMWFGWRNLTERGERIDEKRYMSIQKCSEIIDKHASMLVRHKGYSLHIIDIEPCVTWRGGE